MGCFSWVLVSDYVWVIDMLFDVGLEYCCFGVGVLMLVYVVVGQFYVYYEVYMNSWDVLVGMLLIEEVGGMCNVFFVNVGLW